MTDFNFDEPPHQRFSPSRRQFELDAAPQVVGRTAGEDTPLRGNDSFERRRDLTPTRRMAPILREDDSFTRESPLRAPNFEDRTSGVMDRARVLQDVKEEDRVDPIHGAAVLTAPRPPIGPQFHTLPLPKRRDQPRSGFEIYITGQIDFGELKDQNGMCVKYDFVKGDSWDPITGMEMGISQHANKSSSHNTRMVWNFPFQVGYKTQSPQGWPKLVLQCFGRDGFGRSVMKAYGSIHVPLYPGTHTRFVHMFVPIEASLMGRFVGWLFGKPAEYHDPIKTVGYGYGREVTRVQSGGIIKVTFMVSQVGMEKFGYDL